MATCQPWRKPRPLTQSPYGFTRIRAVAFRSQSKHDRLVDIQIADLYRTRTGSPYFGALIFSWHSSGLTFSGYLSSKESDAITVDRLWAVGDTFRLTRS